MNIILPHADYDADHLAKVIEEMKVLGAPTIKAVDCGEHYVALEGSHRIRAAQALGMEVIIDEIEYSETITTDDVVPGGYQDTFTIAEVVDGSYQSVMLSL
ncbi:hypothetical protein [Brevundimonas faecalis]|uniref:ParB/Sulfiredoxin domain-containing protein n=1 Tax=Brevundimonas faecalis TaxID=947378 RepID=A0ABV2RCE7_9CAUL